MHCNPLRSSLCTRSSTSLCSTPATFGGLKQRPSLVRNAIGMATIGKYVPSTLELGPVIAMKRSTSRYFMYNETGRGLDVGADRFHCDVSVVPPSELFEACKRKGSPYAYSVAPLSSIDEAFVTNRRIYHGSLWIGSEGATTQAHYDVADNVLVQTFGQKRIRVWNPAAHLAFHVFPDAHPRARKAQASVDDDDDPLFPLKRDLPEPILDVILQPGDAIEIPAFWFHHVEALTPSVSVNVFSQSPAADAASQLLATPLPSLDDAAFVASIYASRYKPLQAAYDALEEKQQTPQQVASSFSQGRHDALVAECRRHAGPDAADGVAEIALAHLIELSAMTWFHHDVVQVAAHLRSVAATASPASRD